MQDTLEKLIKIIDLEQTGETSFHGSSIDIGLRHIFGGQVLAQAIVAACRTEKQKHMHSLHAHFFLPGDLSIPINYEVSVVREGRSFSTKQVVALQYDRPIFSMTASFQAEESGFEHQVDIPEIPDPEQVDPGTELRAYYASKLPARYQGLFTIPLPIEIRYIPPPEYIDPKKLPPNRCAWIKTIDNLPDDPVLHNSILAYSSDFGILETAMLPHGVSYMQEDILAASLDHSIWFHRDFKIDEWLLFSMESPCAANARGFCRCTVFTQSGKLVASIAQEGLIRQKGRKVEG